MRLRIHQVNVPLEADDAAVLFHASQKIGCPVAALSDPVVVRRSLDARARNSEPLHVLAVTHITTRKLKSHSKLKNVMMLPITVSLKNHYNVLLRHLTLVKLHG